MSRSRKPAAHRQRQTRHAASRRRPQAQHRHERMHHAADREMPHSYRTRGKGKTAHMRRSAGRRPHSEGRGSRTRREARGRR